MTAGDRKGVQKSLGDDNTTKRLVAVARKIEEVGGRRGSGGGATAVAVGKGVAAAVGKGAAVAVGKGVAPLRALKRKIISDSSSSANNNNKDPATDLNEEGDDDDHDDNKNDNRQNGDDDDDDADADLNGGKKDDNDDAAMSAMSAMMRSSVEMEKVIGPVIPAVIVTKKVGKGLSLGFRCVGRR